VFKFALGVKKSVSVFQLQYEQQITECKCKLNSRNKGRSLDSEWLWTGWVFKVLSRGFCLRCMIWQRCRTILNFCFFLTGNLVVYSSACLPTLTCCGFRAWVFLTVASVAMFLSCNYITWAGGGGWLITLHRHAFSRGPESIFDKAFISPKYVRVLNTSRIYSHRRTWVDVG
jgi:hypothetical protein